MTQSSRSLHDRLLERFFSRLSPDDRRRVVDFADALAVSRPKATPGKEFLRHAGAVSHEDATEMLKAIEDGCEHVNAEP
jgi:hypothetical protein